MTSSSELQVKPPRHKNWFYSLGRRKTSKTDKKSETMTVSRSFANLHSVNDGKNHLNNAHSTPHLPSQMVSQCRSSDDGEHADVDPPLTGSSVTESDVEIVRSGRYKKSSSPSRLKLHFRKKNRDDSGSHSEWDLNVVSDESSNSVDIQPDMDLSLDDGIQRKRSSTMTAIRQLFESNSGHYGGKFEKSRSREKLHSNHVVVDTSETSVTNNRSRIFSTASLDRRQLRKKRSTIWYQQDGDLYKKHQLKDEIAEVTAEMESMDSGEESKNAARAKQLSLGRKKFNMDPKKGIEFLVQQGLLQNTPQDIAAFLYRGEGLSKTAIGDYLGEKSPFHEQVLKAFVDLHDFTDLILVQALRQFLWSFRLPGEAQKIDRMMETFAQRYCQLNPNIFSNTDTCYVLSFAVIMLNTSLHNPSVKEKPTVEQFIAMNRGINDGKDLPRDILESLYDSIKAEPFKIPEDDGNDLMHTFFNPDREGWLWKQGGRYKSWKRRWFILNDNCLYYFEYTTDKEPRGIIPLENIQVREVQDRNKPNCFELYATGGNDFIKACKTDSEGKVVEGKHTVYRMSASTQEEKDDWINRIRQSISHNPFYDMLAARKKKAQKSGQRSKP